MTENDFLGVNNKDENYTGSAKLEYLFPEQKLLSCIFIKYKAEDGQIVQDFSRIGFGGTAYTPQNLKNSAIEYGDRPYASLTFLSIGNTFYDWNKHVNIDSELIIGKIGGNGPGGVQSYIHENHWFGSVRDIPQGWHNQIGYKGSLILNYNVRYQELISLDPEKKEKSNTFRASWLGKVDLGNYMINFQGGMKFSLFNQKDNYNSDILRSRLSNKEAENKEVSDTIYQKADVKVEVKEDKEKKNPGCWFKINFYAEPNIRLAAYNATLEGLLFNDHSVYKIKHSDVKRLLFEITGGVDVLLWNTVYIKYAFFGRTKEYVDGKPFHTWGGATIGVNW